MISAEKNRPSVAYIWKVVSEGKVAETGKWVKE